MRVSTEQSTEMSKSTEHGKMYAINKLGANKIEIESVDHTFQDAEFAEYFVVAFAYTNHKVQGITIKEAFNIYEWSKMVIHEVVEEHVEHFSSHGFFFWY